MRIKWNWIFIKLTEWDISLSYQEKEAQGKRTVHRFEYLKIKIFTYIKIKTKIRLGKYYTSIKYH